MKLILEIIRRNLLKQQIFIITVIKWFDMKGNLQLLITKTQQAQVQVRHGILSLGF